MAVKIDHEIIPAIGDEPAIILSNAYVMIGRLVQDFFHETAEVTVYVWHSEAARRQHPSIPDALRHPLVKIPLQVPISLYRRYLSAEALSAEGNNHQAALYALLRNEEFMGMVEMMSGEHLI